MESGLEKERPNASSDPGPPRRNIRWKRLAIWGMVGVLAVLLVTGGATYLWFRSQVGRANADVDPATVQALDESPATSAYAGTSGSGTTVVVPETPTGVNLVLLGADTSGGAGTEARSDTIMLIHVDPEKDFLSMLSVPRDLRVNVPGHGPQKMNAAYTYGGAALVIRTLQEEFGIDLDHYVQVDFNAFKEITDGLGGVYMDVDRRYDDGKIQLDPGYQLLDGLNALRFVRTRHDTNIDFGRMQRQQRFISALREQAMGWNLPLKLPMLVTSLFGNITTDLSANEFLKLAYWAIGLGGERMKMASVVAGIETVDGVSYILASDKQKAAAVEGFLTPPKSTAGEGEEPSGEQVLPPPATIKGVALAGVGVDVINRTGRIGQAALAAVWLSRQGATIMSARDTTRSPLEGTEVAYPAGRRADGDLVAQALGIEHLREVSSLDRVTVTLGMSYALSADQLNAAAAAAVVDGGRWRALASEVAFPVAAPTYVPASCRYAFSRSYDIAVGDGTRPAFVVGYRYGAEDQFLGVSGTTWLDAPLAGAGEEVGEDGALFTLVGTSTKTDRVWWKKDGVLYWVSNTLLYELSREDLLAVAASMVEVSQ